MSAVPEMPLPPGVARRDLEVRGGPLAVLDATPEDAVGTVLLIPGFTGSKEDFLFLLEPLAAAGLRAVAVDQRGQHDSPGPDDPEAYGVAALAADVLALVDALGSGAVHLVGHSFGGLVSRAAVLDDPSSFRSLVLMGSGPAALTGPRAATLPFMKAILDEGGLHAVWEASQSLPAAKQQPPEVLAFLKKRFLAHHPLALHGMGDALVTEPDRVAELAEVDLPLLVVYGEADDAWLPHLQDDMARRLGAGVVVVPGSVHSPAAENPAFTAETLIRFFREL